MTVNCRKQIEQSEHCHFFHAGYELVNIISRKISDPSPPVTSHSSGKAAVSQGDSAALAGWSQLHPPAAYPHGNPQKAASGGQGMQTQTFKWDPQAKEKVRTSVNISIMLLRAEDKNSTSTPLQAGGPVLRKFTALLQPRNEYFCNWTNNLDYCTGKTWIGLTVDSQLHL